MLINCESAEGSSIKPWFYRSSGRIVVFPRWPVSKSLELESLGEFFELSGRILNYISVFIGSLFVMFRSKLES